MNRRDRRMYERYEQKERKKLEKQLLEDFKKDKQNENATPEQIKQFEQFIKNTLNQQSNVQLQETTYNNNTPTNA